MSHINLLIIGTDYVEDIVSRLLDERVIDTCFIVYQGTLLRNSGVIKKLNDPRVGYFDMRDEFKFRYEELIDLNVTEALSKDLLEGIQPYESMMIKVGVRRFNFPVVQYEEEKRNYHICLRYWNHIFKSRNINYVQLEALPHNSCHYAIYSLAKVYKIPINMYSIVNIPSIRIKRVDSIENNGCSIEKFYNDVARHMEEDECILKGCVKEYYEKYTKTNMSEIIIARKNTGYERSELKRTINEYFSAYYGLSGFLRYYKTYAKECIKALIDKRLSLNKPQKMFLLRQKRICNDISFYKKNLMVKVDEYNKKYATVPDLGNKFIFFALQLTPESTIFPNAGVFAEQYTSIQLLARIGEKLGVKIYVKEHFVQPFRDINFWETLKKIRNVTLVRSDFPSLSLIEYAVAVATQTGSVILESAFNGKPAIVTSSGHSWKGLPSVFEITDEEQGEQVLKTILDGIQISRSDIKKYFYAIQESCFTFYQLNSIEDINSNRYNECLNEQIDIIRNFIIETDNC